MDVLAAAPPEMNAAGYGDLLAKVVAGGDWIIADALEIEPIHRPLVGPDADLSARLGFPARGGPKRRSRKRLADLTLGLIMTGFGMQSARSSRPASGAEHQFSHLWDMQHHTHEGRIPFHGCKVSIGLLASTLMHEQLLAIDMTALDIPGLIEKWPTLDQISRRIEEIQTNEDLLEVARTECREKYVDAATLEQRLTKLQTVWPELRPKLLKQLIPFEKEREMLQAVWCSLPSNRNRNRPASHATQLRSGPADPSPLHDPRCSRIARSFGALGRNMYSKNLITDIAQYEITRDIHFGCR